MFPVIDYLLMMIRLSLLIYPLLRCLFSLLCPAVIKTLLEPAVSCNPMSEDLCYKAGCAFPHVISVFVKLNVMHCLLKYTKYFCLKGAVTARTSHLWQGFNNIMTGTLPIKPWSWKHELWSISIILPLQRSTTNTSLHIHLNTVVISDISRCCLFQWLWIKKYQHYIAKNIRHGYFIYD